MSQRKNQLFKNILLYVIILISCDSSSCLFLNWLGYWLIPISSNSLRPNFLIVLQDSAYTLYDRDFLSNLGSILLFAVVGTLFNVFVVGYGLYGAATMGWMGSFKDGATLNSIESLIFSSLISAVDPARIQLKVFSFY